MINKTYLVPANSKKSQLIFGLFKAPDLIILGVGIFASFMLLIILSVTELWSVIVTLLPIVTCGALVFPIPNYHNVRVLLTEIFKYYKGRKKYIWRGWCYKYEQRDK